MNRSRRRVYAALGAASVISAALIAGTAQAAPVAPRVAALPGDDLPFASAVFKATHNSFSGAQAGGFRGPIVSQLDNGVRFIELDIQDNDYGTIHDYAIGHDDAGDQVDPTGNPASNALRDWLNVIAAWSWANPTHAPLVVMLDVKDNLTDNPSFAAGNMTALNEELQSAFGTSLVMAKDYPWGLPNIGSLRGKVLTLLSGDGASRTEYRRDVGYNPAVAINARGQVVEVHDSGGGAPSLWYWTGTYGPDGRVTWLRHGRFDTGVTPAVALNDNGWLVEVHKSENNSGLWYHVGFMTSDGEIGWSPARKYDNGVMPTVAFTDPAGLSVREIHRSQNNSQRWTWRGAINPNTWTVPWTGNAKTSDPSFSKAFSFRNGSWVYVWAGADGAAPSNTLLYQSDRVGVDRIRYQQTAFVEYQAGDPAVLQEGALFYAAPSTNTSFITSDRRDGYIVRGWDFDNPALATNPLANYPATNNPFAAWYLNLMDQAGAVQ